MVSCAFCGNMGSSFSISKKYRKEHLVLCFVLKLFQNATFTAAQVEFTIKNGFMERSCVRERIRKLRETSTEYEIKRKLRHLWWKVKFRKSIALESRLTKKN